MTGERQAVTHPTTGPETLLDGRFQLEERVGSGGIGSVWRATDRSLQRTVAVKVLHPHLASRPQIAERFRREALTTARLHHPNVLRVYDAGVSDGVAYLVSEFVPGLGVDRLMGRGALASEVVAAIGTQAASALARAHAEGMVHCDVKPSNLLIGPRGRLKLIDFGIAEVVDLASDLSIEGETLGSWAYLAPEQLNSQPVGFAADVYALGLVLWEACTGHAPFGGDTPTATALARLTRPVPGLPELPALPEPLRTAIEAATRTDPDERPDAARLAETISRVSGHRPHQHLAPLVREDRDVSEGG